ncbi:MAG: hypothetical protein JSU96_01180, partial [Acidobacteriota bacterium]
GINFRLQKTERQLAVETWTATLLNVGVNLNGFSRNQDVGDFTGLSNSNILVDSSSSNRLDLAVGDDVDDPDSRITIEVQPGGNIQGTYTLASPTGMPDVEGMPIDFNFRLDGLTFTQNSQDNPPLVQATAISVALQPGGGETGIVTDQGSMVF